MSEGDALRLVELRLHESGRTSGSSKGMHQCPGGGHTDRHPSFLVRQNGAGVKLKCFAGCSQESMLEGLGMEPGDLLDEAQCGGHAQRTKPRFIESYEYTDRHGEPLSRKRRWEPGKDSRPKSFDWEVPKTAGGWRVARRGEGNPNVLFNLPLVIEAEYVYICEGEKAANALKCVLPFGHAATCAPTSRWEPGFTETLKGTAVTLWMDRDEPGKKLAAAVHRDLVAAGIATEIVQSATTTEKSDAFDHVEAGFRIEDAIHIDPATLSEELADSSSQGEEPASSVERFKFVPIEELEYWLFHRGLIKGVIDRGAFVVMYGDSNSSKTFLGIDMGLCVAASRSWHGKKTTKGLVVYVASEGGGSITNRIVAYAERYMKEGPDVSFFVLPQPVNLLDQDGDVAPLIAAIGNLEEATGLSCVLVEIDTLAESMPGGDESGSKDMGAAVASVQRIRREIGCAVILIHHCGKDAARGARGWSGLRAATDTELEVSNMGGGYFQMRPTKQRDYAMGDPFTYRLEVIEIGEDEDGDIQTTCVVVPVDRDEVPTQDRRGKLGARGKILVRCMEELLAEGRGIDPPSELESSERHLIQTGQFVLREEDVRKSFYSRLGDDPDMADSKPDSLRKAFNRTRDAAQASEYIAVYEKYVWFK